jgi:glycosyltransferase involved in cell wall biosynthesis
VTDRVPGDDTGYGIRVRNVVEGLRAAGQLHVVLIDSSRFGVQLSETSGYTTDRIRVEDPPRWVKGVRFGRLLPANVRYHDPAAARAALRKTIGSQPWDVVWCSRARVHLLTDGVTSAPRIVDLDDLSDRLLRSRIVDRRERHGSLATFPLNIRDWVDAALWSRLQRRIAGAVDKVVVCSAADRTVLGVDNCAVVPNGYPEPSGWQDSREPVASKRLLFVGPLTYEPNRLAVEWLIDAVMPKIRAEVPDAELAIVGDDSGVKMRGARHAGVIFAGHVPDVGPHYAAATVAVTPLHSGGGTRIKVIEALARSVPLVSTSFGCVGHDLVPGRDLLVANDATSFAEACVRLLDDERLRNQIAKNGRRVYDAGLTARSTVEAVAAVAREAVGMTNAASPDGDGRRPPER